MKEKESLSSLLLNFFDISGEDLNVDETLRVAIRPYIERKEAFALIFQPGAGAPVGSFLDDWKAAGLGGCTAELKAICDLNLQNIIIINSMRPEEQNTANLETLPSKGLDVDKLKALTIINDPMMNFKIFLSLDADAIHTVKGRAAYRPQAMIFDAEGNLSNIIHNDPEKPGEARSSQAYLQKIQEQLKAPQPVPVSYLRRNEINELKKDDNDKDEPVVENGAKKAKLMEN